jgi:predicted amidohydrolase YtcJ
MVALKSKYQSAHLMIPTAKIFVDGVIEARTAALLEPYIGYPDERGEPNYSPQFLNALVDGLITAGFQVHCHAIGDRAIRMALDAYEHAGPKARLGRHHIAHLELLHPDGIILPRHIYDHF